MKTAAQLTAEIERLQKSVEKQALELESKNRELEIEAALERVRSRTMAMQQSSELNEVSVLLYKELMKLGISDFFNCGYVELHEKSKVQYAWLTRDDGTFLGKLELPLTGDNVLNERYEAWKIQKPLFSQVLNFNQLKNHLAFISPQYNNKEADDVVKRFPNPTIFYNANFKYGYLHINTGKYLDEEGESILIRFTQVFSQTYTRFLDLQKAETQAREAQIEVSLERVRSRSMAMHKSEELIDTATLLYQELSPLGIQPYSTGFILVDEKNEKQEVWFSAPGGKSYMNRFFLPLTGDPVLNERYRNWKNKEPIYYERVAGEKLIKHLQFVSTFFGTREAEEQAQVFPECVFFYCGYFPQGYLHILTENMLDADQESIMKRFTQAFSMTYTRFLDLQKAEAQAKEAQVETALERIRSSAMAMHSSDGLSEVAAVLREQMALIGQKELESCIVQLYEKGSDHYTAHYSFKMPNDPDEELIHDVAKEVPWKETEWSRQVIEKYNSGADNFIIHADQSMLKEWYAMLARVSPRTVAYDKNGDLIIPDGLYYYFACFSGGFLSVISYKMPEDETQVLLNRAANTFDMAFRRYLDLKKAEAQAREAEIEAALERVRSASMAMHKSKELNDVATVLFQQIRHLGGNLWTCGIVLCQKDSEVDHFMVALENGMAPTIEIPNTNDPATKNMYHYWKKGAEYYVEEAGGKDLKKHYDYLETLPTMKPVIENLKASGISLPTWQKWHAAYFTHGYLMIITLEPYPQEEVFKRFAKVFEQTYTRFLDLKKAEAQAREAKIEAALERVRSKAMAMHNSSDLANANSVVFNELNSLGISPLRSGIGLIEEEIRQGTMYATVRSGQGNNLLLIGKISLTGNKVLESIFDYWNKKQIYCPKLNGQELKQYYDLILASYGGLPKPKFSKNEVQYGYFLPFKHGSFYAWTQEPFSEDELKTIQRFVSVIDLTYNRYFELQKAEAQARDAQVETALERIRSRTMGMQRSKEMLEVGELVYKELSKLGIDSMSCGITLVEKAGKMDSYYVVNPDDGSIMKDVMGVPRDETKVMRSLTASWEKQEPYHIVSLNEKETILHQTYIPENSTNFPFTAEELISYTPSRLNLQTFNFKHGYLILVGADKLSQDKILTTSRFAKVFEQTYTRFLDLQKAEAQAREAQIETSLERVRSKTMAMHKSEELAEVASVLFEQISLLTETPSRFNIAIVNEEEKNFDIWVTDQKGENLNRLFVFETEKSDVVSELFNAWKAGERKIIQHLSDERLKKWLSYASKEAGVPFDKKEIKKHRYINSIFFKHGFIGITTDEVPEKNVIQLLERFAKVFEQTYTRFLDLQKAEAREKEAIKQSSLDRVRAEIASMRNTEDLQRITPLIWRELLTLGVPFFRCGLMIVDEKEEKVRFYLSTPDGNPLAALNLDFESNDISSNGIKNWRIQQPYIAHWNKEEFLAFTKTLIDQQQIDNPTTYQGGEAPPESLTLQFIPFPQGMLYVGSAEDLSPAQIDLVQNLANAFSVAYARYEDFKQLEDAKSKIEHTLSELKSAQSQLIQSEKMASLGELTAGIAHEIQNPLNFVNNFSEVSSEMFDELMEEIEKGDMEEVKALSADIKENLIKIKHHGKRADSIVKGMLEHSRSSSGEKTLTDINALADEFLRLSYHGIRAKDKSFNSDFKLELDPLVPKINIIGKDIGRVILNLVNNAFYAVNEKAKEGADDFRPMVLVSTKRSLNGIELSVKDNGNGIPDSVKDKIFQPFFTTKPTGSGTGLGLSLSYDIVKAHGGEFRVESKEGKGSEFVIYLTNGEATL